MQFVITEEHEMIRKAARDFAINDCLPGVIERDEHQRFPIEQIRRLAELGFMGMMAGLYGHDGRPPIWRVGPG